METGAGKRREKHFKEGGTIAGWRGRAKRFKDEKKEASKKACRKKEKWSRD